MKTIAQIISWLALAAVIVPPLVYLGGGIELGRVKFWMLVGTIAWFATVPLWMGRKHAN